MALAIVPSGQCSRVLISLISAPKTSFFDHILCGITILSYENAAGTAISDAPQAKDFDPTGWELALVAAPSANLSSVQERQLVCPCANASDIFSLFLRLYSV